MYKMKEEILRDKLQNLSSEQLEWINTYCENDMSKLKKISYNAFFRYGIPQYEHDELYDDAIEHYQKAISLNPDPEWTSIVCQALGSLGSLLLPLFYF